MVIESIRLHNIKSFANAEIHFKKGVNFIKGANGTGKSTLIESVGFALFNVTTTGFSGGIHSYLLREGEREGEVLVRFCANGLAYEVLRTVSMDANRRKWQIWCEGESAAGLLTDRDRVAFLQDAMGIPPEQKPDKLFCDMIGVRQGQFKAPFEDSQANRIRYFNEIFGVADFNRARDNMALVRRNIQAKRAELQTLWAVLEGTVSQLGAKKEALERLQAEQKALQDAFVRLTGQCKKAKENYDLHVELEKLVTQIDLIRQNGEKQIRQAEQENKELSYECMKLKEQENAVLQERKAHLKRQNDMEGVLKALDVIRQDASKVAEYLHRAIDRIAYDRENVIKSLEEAKIETAKLADGVCPYFGEACEKMQGEQGKQAASRMEPILQKLKEIETQYTDAMMRPRKMEWEKHLLAYNAAAQELGAAFGKNPPEPKSSMEPFLSFCKTEQEPGVLYEALTLWTQEIGQVAEMYETHAAQLKNALDERNQALISKSAAAGQALAGIQSRLAESEKKCTGLRHELENAGQKEKRRDEILEALGANRTSVSQAQGELTRISVEAGQADEQLKSNKNMLESLSRDIEEMEKTRLKIEEYQMQSQELAQAGKTAELLGDLLRRAGGRVAELYTGRISKWASQMYRGVAEDGADLQFDTEYDAKLVDIYKGNTRIRSFNQLSGGQRMMVALCVRIAMLTCFAGLPIAFFDEPTENIDAGKKLNLAENMKKNLGEFTQIFIISHDDAFDRLTENVIYLEETREGTVCGAL